MKKMKKLFISAIALMMAFSTVACGGGGGNGESSSTPAGGSESSAPAGGESSSTPSDGGEVYIPQNPYTIKLYNFTGGYGDQWLEELESRYQKERAGDTIVVDGKVYDGVVFADTKAKDTMSVIVPKGDTYDVWFQEQVSFNQYVDENVFKDMTDVLTSDNPYEPGTTLESKLTAEQRDYYMRDGKYYGMPHYAGYIGIAYNKKMFDDGCLYFAKNYDKTMLENDPASCLIWDLTDDRTPGPDGIEGTTDDGLPTTYAEFYGLCEVIAMTNKPISWSGKHRQSYLGWFLQALANNNETYANAVLNYSFEGTADSLISVSEKVDGQPVITELDDLVLDAKENGWNIGAQRGKYYALDFLETIVDNGWYTEDSFSNVDEQTAAQIDFVEGDANDATERAAMLIDGSWWEMEAKSSFLALEQGGVQNPKDNFGWLPLPCVTEAEAEARATAIQQGGKGYNLTDVMNSLCFIGAQVSDDVYAIVKDFIQFAYTDESLAEFSIVTDTTKAVSYTMTEDQKAQMSGYGRSLWDMQGNANIVSVFSKNEFYQNNETLLVQSHSQQNFAAMIDGKETLIPVDQFKKGINAGTYFEGMVDMYEYRWGLYIL